MSESPPDELTLATDAASLRRAFTEKLFLQQMKAHGHGSTNDYYLALSYVIRDRILARWARSSRTFHDGDHRTVRR